ncbi:outer membrane receptor protein involved in Fe transport [Sphingomonas kyeonggiensis]|uniref:TonB-dependent receptor domain-containing protein n=1 Tax=Sphingomonas kyeonggiensis TaxID=1268553 RepID=UPI00278B9D19|nr:TonB-dependent receptor [Sphingomonas kyeonggiensis]MDQ0248014.1 outer membrane receptor protein involved in Fe transport [Sphingomonas kyeonggiensis]
MKLTRLLGATALAGSLLTVPGMAWAQETTEACTPGTENCPPTDETIVVTGSRIRQPNLETISPVTTMTAEDLAVSGSASIGDKLNELPALRSTYSQANSTRFIGTTGLNLLDLRGLGIERTLVLVNGRRHVTALPGSFLVDVQTIPSDLIERVDVITGGSSAVYGSDAIAGVVNFVLKDNFEGIKLNAQNGISNHGDRNIYFVSGTAGTNFAGGRGNIAANFEYTHADALYNNQRDDITGAYSGRCQMQLNDFTTGEPQSGDGVPDSIYLCGVRNNNISTGGTMLANLSAANCQNAAYGPNGANAAIGAARCLNPGTIYGQPRTFRFSPSGQLLEDVPSLDFRPYGSGNVISNPNSAVPGTTLRETGQLAPGLDRYNANALFKFEFSPALEVFAEGKYVHLKSIQEGQPSFYQSIANTIGLPNLTCDNAFLTAANLASLQAIGYCSAGATNTQSLPLGRFNVDFGGRSEIVTRDTWRIVAGLRGNFNDDWHYELSATYGEVKIRQDEHNDLVIADTAGNLDGFSLAYDAVRNGAGQIVCRVNQVTVTRSDCVPINMFGYGAPSAAALNFVNTTSWVKSNASELDILGYVSGDSSQVFELPGGPVAFVLGGEYRRETAYQVADPRSAAGGTFFNAFSEFDPPAFEVKEVFGELSIPLLKDLPFARELTITGAARYSDYNTSAGSTFAWNAGGTWSPVRDFRFRVNYSRSVRVPTLDDLYSSASQNFAFLQDPCDALYIGNGTTNRATNCSAQGIPVGFINAPARAASTGYLSAGNPSLSEEQSSSWTIGGVFTPSFMPGFTFTADYYNITLNNRIEVLGAQTILNQCYDLPQPNEYCGLLTARNADFTFQDPALTSAGINFAKGTARGIDFEMNYAKKFDDFWSFNFHGVLTYVIERDNYVSPTNPTIKDQQLQELGDPQWAANATFLVGAGPATLRWNVNYIGKQTIGAYENYFPLQGRPPQNADANFPIWYQDVFYHAVKLDIKANKQFTFYLGVDNLFDTKPPLGELGVAGGSPFDAIGRYFYAGVKIGL